MQRPGRLIAAGLLAAVTMCAAGATAAEERAQAGPAYRPVGSWGGAGTGNGQFGSNAFGLATDKSGNVYVADSDQRRIQVFSPSGTFRRTIPVDRSVVVDVAIDAAGNVWGTTDTNAEARQYSPAGLLLATAATPKSALGIGADAGGGIYVSTSGDDVHSVVHYDKAAAGYEAGPSWGGFQVPGDVEVCADGTVYVADNRALNVRHFDGNGKLLKTIKGGRSAPIGIGVDPDCNVWMTNIAERRLEEHSPDGALIATATGEDLIAQDVVVGPNGDLYAFDSGSQRIVRFALAPPAGTPTGTVLVDGAPFSAGTVPYGSTVDVTNGALVLKTEVGTLKVSGAGGVPAAFKLVRDTVDKKPIVELRLVKGDFGACPKRKKSGAGATPPKTVRQLWGSGNGTFRTRGRYATAAVRGTRWLTADRCDGTQVRVTQGTVQVADLPHRKQVVLRAGGTYTAKP